MSHKVFQTVSGRLSLRKPQRDSLEALQKAIAASPDMLHPKRDVADLLEI
jgi:type III restriction enzyme